MATIPELLIKQRTFFSTQKTKSIEFRKDALRKLIQAIEDNEEQVFHALHQDLHKSSTEAFISEVALLIDEARFAIKNLDKWARPKRVSTPLVQAIGKSFIHSEPLGVVLIIGPWNYPFQLVVAPLIGAIAAGNCAVLKPSELAPATSQCLKNLIQSTFEEDYIAVVEGGVETSEALLKERWDHIFFTGGAAVGKIIMKSAAHHLTPVTLELGGKSPCIIDEDVDLAVAIRRITWGKFFNAGQTCVAPDYLLVPKGKTTTIVQEIQKWIEASFGREPKTSPDYARIISDRHYQRLKGFLAQGTVALGGKTDDVERYFSPTVLTGVDWNQKVMQEEIFGPILPILEYQDLSDAIATVNAHPKPLALYFFSKNEKNQNRIIAETSFGGGCMNDTLTHLANPRLPFGGVGDSGMGNYHGQFSFDTFSHKKSIVKKTFFPDLSLRYPPYSDKLDLLKKFLG